MANFTETITTIFEGDVSRLRDASREAAGEVQKVSTATDGLAQAEKKAATEAGNLGAKFNTLQGARQQVQTTTRELGKLEAGANRAGNARGLTVMRQRLQQLGTRARALATQVGTGLRTAWNRAGQAARGALGQVGGLLGGIGGQVSSIASSIPGVGGAFAALAAPIGVAAAAIGGFVASSTRLDVVATKLDGLKVGFGLLADSIGRASGELLGIADADGGNLNVGKAAGADNLLGRFLRNTTTGRLATAAVLPTLAVGQQIADLQDTLADTEGRAKVRISELNKEVQSLLPKLRDRTLSIEERLALTDRIAAKEQEAVKVQRAANADRLQVLRQIQREEEKRLRNAGGAAEGTEEFDRLAGTDATRRAIEAAQVELNNFEASSFAITERVQAQRNRVLEEASAEEAKALKARQDAAAKAAAEAEKLEQQRLAAFLAVEATIAQVATEEQRAKLTTDLERELFDIEQKAADILEKLGSAFDAQREATTDPEGLAAIDAQQAEAEAQVAAQTERLKEEAKKRVREEYEAEQRDAAAQLNDALATEDERAIEAVREKYRKLLELNEKYTEDAAEQARIRAALEAAQAQEEADAVKTEAEKAAEEERERQAERLQLFENTTNAVADLVGNAAAQGQEAAEEASKAVLALGLDVIQQLILQELRRLQIITTSAQVQAQAQALASPQSALTGGTAGLIQGALIAGLIQALFTAAKGQIQQLAEGTLEVKRGPHPPGIDTVPAMLTEGEAVTPRKQARKHRHLLAAIHADNVPGYVNATYAIPMLADFLASPDGQRSSTSVMLAKYHDRNIVRAVQQDTREARRTNELLTALLAQRDRGPSKRYYGTR